MNGCRSTVLTMPEINHPPLDTVVAMTEHKTEISERVRDMQECFRNHILNLNINQPMGNLSFDFERVFPHTENNQELLGQIDDLKRCLDSFRPLTAAESAGLAEAFDLEYTYESNRIEGNSLTLRETQVVLERGMTIGGKPLADHLEAISHRDALILIKSLAHGEKPIKPSVLLDINRIILRGSVYEDESGRFRIRPVRITGSRHTPPNWVVVPDRMDGLFADFERWHEEGKHPIEVAADLHFHIVRIHPFVDGNGRTARLIMNLYLLNNGYTIANLSGSNEDRKRYYDTLDQASLHENLDPFRTLIYEREKASLIWHLSGLMPDAEKGRGVYFLERIKDYL